MYFIIFCCTIAISVKLLQKIIILVNGENKKKSLMAFVYRVLWILKALWIALSETIHILRKN